MNSDSLRILELIRAYHDRTKHRLDKYAAGPDFLDWEQQPDPFRRFEASASIALPFEFDAQRVSGEWHSFTPFIVMSDLRLTVPGDTNSSIELGGGRIGLDVLASLRTFSLRVTALELQALSLEGELRENGCGGLVSAAAVDVRVSLLCLLWCA